MPDCDVAVVGAGVIGAAITYELVARGASVTLLDCRGAGLGSTQAAAGMLVPYLEGFGRPLCRSRQKPGDVRRIRRSRLSRCGNRHRLSAHRFAAGRHRRSADRGAAAHRRRRARGRPQCELLDEHAVREAEPQLTPEVSGALFMKRMDSSSPGICAGRCRPPPSSTALE